MRHWLPGLLTLTLLTGCPFPGFPGLETKGSPSLVKRLAADEIQFHDWQFANHLESLLQGGQVTNRFTLELDDFTDKEQELINRVFPDYRSAIAYAESKGHGGGFLASADQVTAVTKQINDGVYARFELALEQGEGGFPAKKAWLRQLLDKAMKDVSTPARRDLAARLAGGLTLASESVSVPAAVQARLDEGLTAFNKDPIQSKPIGFFTWNQPLQTVFVRDRWLQGWFGDDNRAWLIRNDGTTVPEHLEAGVQAALLLEGETKAGYEKTLAFYQRMTNKFSGFSPLELNQFLPPGKSLQDALQDAAVRAQMLAQIKTMSGGPFYKFWAVLPPSTSPEMELFYKLDALGQLPPGADRMQVLIDAIRQGKLSLAPQADTGYYTYQQHALEALLKVTSLPEAQQVSYGAKYQKRLEEAFKTGMTKARETHAKQLDLGVVPTAVHIDRIAWVVEPLPTYYERQAAGYRYLREKVLPLFDGPFLKSTKALEEGGKEGALSLEASLIYAEQLMSGLAALANAEIGLTTLSDASKVQVAVEWLKGIGKDARLGVDTRVAVPVNQYMDGNRKMVQYWGTAGVSLNKLKIEGAGDKQFLIVSDKFIFFDRPYTAGPLDRREYRAILDGSATLEEALRHLRGD